MYTIFCDDVCIFSNNTPSDQMQIVEASLSLEDNSTGSLDFTMRPDFEIQGCAEILTNQPYNVRSSPNVDPNNVIGLAQYGEVYNITSSTHEEDNVVWRQIWFENQLAWIDSKCLKIIVEPVSSIQIERMRSQITVFRDGKEIFEGRAITEETDFMKNKKYHCEGSLSYLLDTIQPKKTFRGLVREFFEDLINTHNAKADSNKQFTVGAITANGNMNPITVEINYEDTLSLITSTLVNSEDASLQGHLIVRKQDGIRYLDYLKDLPNTNTQTIQFGENLLDFSKNFDLSELATVIIPLGDTIESESGEESDRVTIAEANGGSIYLENVELSNRYGRIERTVTFDGVTSPTELKQKAEEWFSSQRFDDMTLEVSVLDLHALNPDIEAFDLLDNVRCVSAPHGMDRFFPVTKIEIDLLNPDGTSITLNYSGQEGISSSNIRTAEEIDSRLKTLPSETAILDQAKRNATEIMNMITNGFITIVTDEEDGHSSELIISDTEDWHYSSRLWKWNINGLAYSNDGGKTWGLAMTMDGSIVADFITAGVMSADRIQGGKLILGGLGNYKGVLIIQDSDGREIGRWDKDGASIITGRTDEEAIKIQKGQFGVYYAGQEVGYLNASADVQQPDSEGSYEKGVSIGGKGGIIFVSPLLGICIDGWIPSTGHGTYHMGGNGTIKVITDISNADGKTTYTYRNLVFRNGIMTSDLGGDFPSGGGSEHPDVKPPNPQFSQNALDEKYKKVILVTDRFYSDFIVQGDPSYTPNMGLKSAYIGEFSKSNATRLDYFINGHFVDPYYVMSSDSCRLTKTSNVGPIVGEIEFDSSIGAYKFGETQLPDIPLIECLDGRSRWPSSIPKTGQTYESLHSNLVRPRFYIYTGYYYDGWYISGIMDFQYTANGSYTGKLATGYGLDTIINEETNEITYKMSVKSDFFTNSDESWFTRSTYHSMILGISRSEVYAPNIRRMLSAYSFDDLTNTSYDYNDAIEDIMSCAQFYWDKGSLNVLFGASWGERVLGNVRYDTHVFNKIFFYDSVVHNSTLYKMEPAVVNTEYVYRLPKNLDHAKIYVFKNLQTAQQFFFDMMELAVDEK